MSSNFKRITKNAKELAKFLFNFTKPENSECDFCSYSEICEELELFKDTTGTTCIEGYTKWLQSISKYAPGRNRSTSE